jgi:hypothetical protein
MTREEIIDLRAALALLVQQNGNTVVLPPAARKLVPKLKALGFVDDTPMRGHVRITDAGRVVFG